MILEGYGLSETSPVASFNQPGQERKPGSIGTRVEGVQMGGWSTTPARGRWSRRSSAATT